MCRAYHRQKFGPNFIKTQRGLDAERVAEKAHATNKGLIRR